MSSKTQDTQPSLEDRITKPSSAETPKEVDDSQSSLDNRINKPVSASKDGTNVEAEAFVPEQSSTKVSWADEVASPVAPNPDPVSATQEALSKSTLDDSQTDGGTEVQGGGSLHEPDYSVEVKLSDIQADPNNPLYSVKSFDELGLSKEILDGLYQMRFSKPSKIQEKALPLLLSNPPQNLIGQSQSGTGKTAAFVLTMLTRLDLSKPTTPQALCLAPSRELARQILGVVQIMGAFVPGLTVSSAIPADISQKGRKVEGQIVVGTPGTVLDMVKRKTMDARGIKVLVLDEADNMLNLQGLGDQCIRARSMLPPSAQVVLFSATFPENVINYAMKFAPNANQITLKHEEQTVEGIKQLYMDCDSEQAKYDALVRLYGLMTIGSSIIFVRTRQTADNIYKRLTAENHKVVSLTGAYEGVERDRIIDAFRTGEAKVLIATNVLARGIDVQTVSMVINYDIPDQPHSTLPHTFIVDPETYLHRIGRTGRFGRVGVSISFVHDKDSWRKLHEIELYFNVNMIRLDTQDWDAVEDTVKRVIKSSRAGSNLQTTSETGDSSMGGFQNASL
ncbi:MAG: RNA helicase required for poly(A+) mRNA export [Candelaria pacifica]|nr:MAG: RNA helicase required for poly(A+) mRNA export [Candelaria pacifica]